MTNFKEICKAFLPQKHLNQATSIYSIFKNPKVELPFLINDFKQDWHAISKQISYPTHFILICGLPKSGTTWIEQIFLQVPGFIQQNKSPLRGFSGFTQLVHAHDINHEMLLHPKNRYSFLKLHCHYSDKNIKVIEEAGVHPIIMIRDIRDMMISRYFHIISQPDHWMHDLCKDVSPQEGFSKSLYSHINGEEDPIEYYIKWIKDWINYHSNNPNKCLIITYEALKKDTFLTCKNMLEFHGIVLNDLEIEALLLRQKEAQNKFNKDNLKANLNQSGRTQSTLRKGAVGGWQEFMTPEQVKLFDQKAHNIIEYTNQFT
ncbi:MAG: sulfotransferase domain-containing protein [Methylocystaceae bacterium]|nr:sulfotransferase domain-containing protein [Methylocystaceae bacterium]